MEIFIIPGKGIFFPVAMRFTIYEYSIKKMTLHKNEWTPKVHYS